MKTFALLGLIGASLLTSGSSALAKVHGTAMREVGSGYRVLLFDKVSQSAIPNQRVQCTIIYSNPRKPSTKLEGRTDAAGVVYVRAPGDARAVRFDYRGVPGVFAGSSYVDQRP